MPDWFTVFRRSSFHIRAISHALNDFYKNVVPYVGYSENRNLGDEVLFRIAKRQLSSSMLLPEYISRGRYISLSKDRRKWVFGGGSLLFDDAILSKCEWLIKWGLPFVTFGTGSRPLPTNEKLRERWRNVLNHALVLGVRGQISLQSLQALGYTGKVVGDLGFLVNLDLPTVEKPDKRIIVSLRSTGLGSNNRNHELHDYDQSVLNMFIPVIKWLQLEGYKIIFFSAASSDEDKINAWLRTFNNRYQHHIVYNGSLDTYFNLAKRARLVLTMRMHPAIFAAAWGVPTLMLESRPKYYDTISIAEEQFNFINPLNETHKNLINVIRAISNEPFNQRRRRFDAIRSIALEQQIYCEQLSNMLNS